MAFIQVNLLSRSLMRTVPVNVILPIDKLMPPDAPKREDKPFKTLYLLHGVFGNYTDWVCGTRIQRFAEEHDLAVVMPSGDNAFYVDQPASGNFYGEFIGKELVELTRKMFHLSHRREDTFIGGLSMGGYGALRNGLKYSSTFGSIVCLSGALHLEQMAASRDNDEDFLDSRSFAESCFGDLSKLIGSDKDPKALIEKLKNEGSPLPHIYMACGTEDDLLAVNRDMVKFFKKQGLEHKYEEGPGGHDWDFWDTYIKRAIEWLPTEKTPAGINSGNVKA